MTTTHDHSETTSTDDTTEGHGAEQSGGVGAAWMVPARVEQLLDNPADPRRGNRDTATLVKFAGTIRRVGILQALTVIPVENGAESESQRFVIYAGHRRRDAARLAAAQVIAEALGHDTAADPTLAGFDGDVDDPQVRDDAGHEACAAADALRWLPCWVRPDLAGELGMDVAAGLIENGVRQGLTRGEHSRQAAQLSLGWSVTRVAEATGITRREAKAAAALPRLGRHTQEAAERGELSLEHVAVLDGLATDGATEEEITRVARSGAMFDHQVTELSKTLRRRAAAAELRDQVDAHGWTLYEVPDGYPLDAQLAPLWSLSRIEDPEQVRLLPRSGEAADPTADRTAAGYAAMPAHGVILHDDTFAEPTLEIVCADPDAHGYRRDPLSMLADTTDPDPADEEPPGEDPTDQAVADQERADHDGTDQDVTDQDVTDQDVTDQDVTDNGGRDEASERDSAERAAGQARERAAREEAQRAEAERRREAAEAAEAERAQRRAENERIEAARAAAQAHRDAAASAAETRWRYITGLLRTQKAAAVHAELATVVLARFPWLLHDADYFADQPEVSALCPAPDRDPRTGSQSWTPKRMTHRAVALAAWVLQLNLTAAIVTDPALMGRIELMEAEPALWWLDYLIATGYQLAEVETEARHVLDEVVTTNLAAEHGQPTEPEDGTAPDAG